MIHRYCKEEGGREREDKFLCSVEDDLHCHPVVILMLHLIHKKLIIKSVE